MPAILTSLVFLFASGSAILCTYGSPHEDVATVQRRITILTALTVLLATVGVTFLYYTAISLRELTMLPAFLCAISVATIFLLNGTNSSETSLSPRYKAWPPTGVCVFAVFVLGGVASRKAPALAPLSGYLPTSVDRAALFRSNAPSYGDHNAPLKVVAFSDPVCPVCNSIVPWLISEAQNHLKGKIEVIYRHYPLPMHHGAKELALLEAYAERHGMFDAFRRKILSTQGKISASNLDLSDLGLSGRTQAAILDPTNPEGRKCRQLLDQDWRDGTALRVSGTPCFFLVDGGKPVEWILGGEIKKRVE